MHRVVTVAVPHWRGGTRWQACCECGWRGGRHRGKHDAVVSGYAHLGQIVSLSSEGV